MRVHHVPFSQRRLADWIARGARGMQRLADVETRLLREAIADVDTSRPVWICGMARAGSTVLLEFLADAPVFATHRYSDYPWLWTPYWWNHLYERLPLARQPLRERAHRDRLVVGPRSPEAFEEVFWMHFFPGRHDPAVDQVLDAGTRNPAFERFLDEHMRKLVAVRHARRYLAKANEHLPRLEYLARLYPQARFVVPVRDPVAQIASLVAQDRLFGRLDAEDPDVGRHLARAGHFEFGPQKQALNLGDPQAAGVIADCFAGGRVAEGFARQWAAQYGHALDRLDCNASLREACLWIGYERLCEQPAAGLRRIGRHVGLAAADLDPLVERHAPRLSPPDYASPFTAEEAGRLREITAPVFARVAEYL
ncbi:sulfotransferase [Dokdonella koreensis]|uniref:sulfotransferase n=1 Tax=Dokdonella koreensis TaxID=323415 RepID=UPI000A04186F|nr:sulfotransferase [Dokdonella koreensis]